MSTEEGRNINLVEAKKVVGLKSNAFKDYLSARVLFNHGLNLQAAIFANTAIEKEIKGYLAARGIDISQKIRHNTEKLYALLSEYIPVEADKINKEFIIELSRIYKARYTDSLNPGFNFTIIRNKYLAELDYSFSILEPLFKFRLGRHKDFGDSAYQRAVKVKDSRLFLNNHILDGISKTNFLTREDIVTEFRILPNHELLEVVYKIPSSLNDGRFAFEALKLTSLSSVQLSHKSGNKNYFPDESPSE
jgi:HEPN domain-containing protein